MERQAQLIEKTGSLIDASESPIVHNPAKKTDEFDEFRRIILSEEHRKIASLQKKLDELQSQLNSLPPASVEEVSNVLGDAVTQSYTSNNEFSRSTLPLVEDNIRQSVKENPQVLAEALFPAIGPAIRKSIGEALGTMVQSLNQTIEYSFSPKSVKWRIEALQTGKPFAEVVLLKTLLYRVEQIFLIHRETGLLLQHVTANASVEQDADMVSAMLTAIQDFVKDSFINSPDAMLDTLKVGELAVWIERTPNLVFAAVIRGNAPLALREEFKSAVDQIEANHEINFHKFNGDTEPFERSRSILEDCLKYKVGEKNNKKKNLFSPFNLITAAVLLAACVVGFFLIRDYWRWSSYVADLKSQPGIVVTDARRGWFSSTIQGLRDPHAVDPKVILEGHKINGNDVISNWEEYQSSNSLMILARAKRILNPPETVSMTFENGVLTVNGQANAAWFQNATQLSSMLVGVKEFKIDPKTLTDLQTSIENETLDFVCTTANFTENQSQNINRIGNNIETLAAISKSAKLNLKVEVQGNTDASGSEGINSKLRQMRAEKTISALFTAFPTLKNVDIKPIGTTVNNIVGCKSTFKLNLEQ